MIQAFIRNVIAELASDGKSLREVAVGCWLLYYDYGDVCDLKVTPDLRGCPRGKNLYVRHFKGKHSKLYIVGKLNKCRFWKKI